MRLNKSISVVGPAVYAERGIIKNASITSADGLIQSIAKAEKFSSQDVLRFPETYHIVPGFIDLHTHGAQGHDVMDATAEALSIISQALAAEGTTAFLATTMTAEISQIEAALINVRDFMREAQNNLGATILGVHLEGPFLASEKMGAQRGDKIIAPDVSLVKHWQSISNQSIKLVTLAPEKENSDLLIRYLKEQKIIASIGHTNATYAESIKAIAEGCSHATHLFNAMSGIHQREPGAVTAALLAESVMVELILDGFHLHPAIVELVLKLKGKDKIVLITDAMRAKCLQEGCYDLGGQEVHVQAGQARLANGVLAGSVLPMSSAIKNMLKFTHCELFDAVKMAAENPAQVLGLFDKKGSLAVGKDADFVVLDEGLDVVMTVVSGRIIYRKV